LVSLDINIFPLSKNDISLTFYVLHLFNAPNNWG
jgi:hypothetical protein